MNPHKKLECELCNGEEEYLLSPAKQECGNIVDEVWIKCPCRDKEREYNIDKGSE